MKLIVADTGPLNYFTLGILRSAAEAGILDLEDAVRRLQLTSIRISPSIIADVLQNRKPPTDS